MMMKLLLAILVAFVISVAIGKWYVPWLKKHGAKQPIKDEVAAIYAEKETAADPGDNDPGEKKAAEEDISDK